MKVKVTWKTDGRGNSAGYEVKKGKIIATTHRILVVKFDSYVECFKIDDPHYKFEFIRE